MIVSPSAGVRTPCARSVPKTCYNTGAHAQVNTVLSVQIREHRPDLRAQDPHQRERVRGEHRHLGAEHPRTRGHLTTDPPRPHHHNPTRLRDPLPQDVGVPHRAQRNHTRQVGTGTSSLLGAAPVVSSSRS